MNNQRLTTDVQRIAILIVCCFICYCIGNCKGGKQQQTEIIRTDTLVVERWDTMVVEKPTERIRYVVSHDTATELVVITDTLTDSVKVVVPIEQAVYSDSTENATYTAFVSGYKAAIDSISIQCKNTETIITNTERVKNSRFGVGVQLGVGVSPKGVAAPYIGVGVQYRLFGK